MIIHVGLLIVIGAAWVWGYLQLSAGLFALDIGSFNDWIYHAKQWMPVASMSLIMANIFFPPLAATWVTLGTGYMYGVELGFLLSYVASVLASFIIFFILRITLQPILRQVLPVERYQLYQAKIWSVRWAVLWFYVVPLFPSAVITIVLGLTNISWKKFSWFILLGFIPNLILSNLFPGWIALPQYQYVLFGAIGVGFILLLFSWWLSRRA